MLNIEQCRKRDSELSNLTDEEVLEIRDAFYEFGQLAFERWIKEKNVSKNPVGLLRDLKEDRIVKLQENE